MKVQDQIDDYIFDILKLILPGNTYKVFTELCWGNFRSELGRALRNLAYNRYLQWLRLPPPVVVKGMTKEQRSKRVCDSGEERRANKKSKGEHDFHSVFKSSRTDAP